MDSFPSDLFFLFPVPVNIQADHHHIFLVYYLPDHFYQEIFQKPYLPGYRP